MILRNTFFQFRTCRRLSSTTSENFGPDNGQNKQLHPMSVQTRRKTVHHHQRADPRVDPRGISGLGLNTTSPETPRSEQIEQNRHLEVASCTGNGNGATPSPQKRANNRSVLVFKLVVTLRGNTGFMGKTFQLFHFAQPTHEIFLTID